MNPNGSTMVSTHECELHLPGLPLEARRAHIVPALSSPPLISMGVFCDAGCDVHLNKEVATVEYEGRTVLTGPRDEATRLWMFDLAAQPPPTCLAGIERTPVPPDLCLAGIGQTTAAGGTPAGMVAFSHACLFSPQLSTLQTALDRGYIIGFPGLTAKSLKKYPPQSIAMHKGHLDQERKNQRSTKVKAPSVPPGFNDLDLFPATAQPEQTNACYVDCITRTGQIYTDQTGRLPSPSSAGNHYLMVLYDYDSNAILIEPLKNRQGPTILAAYKNLHTRLVSHGARPRLQRLDNECSKALKKFMQAEGVDYQLVPPGMHRRNAAERAIRTCKNHLIAGFCSTDPDSPFHLWDAYLEQAEISLNLLRGSRINPSLSAWQQLFGNFDFNRTPLAPPGVKILAHVKPSDRKSWAPHAVEGWYVGPAMESYRCFKVWIAESRSTRICDTVSWFPHHLGMPLASNADLIRASLADIAQAVKQPAAPASLAPLFPNQVEALAQLTELFGPEPSPQTATESAPVLRVPTTAPPTTPTTVPAPAPALRVPTAAPPTAPTTVPAPTPALRVPTATHPTRAQRVSFDPKPPTTWGKRKSKRNQPAPRDTTFRIADTPHPRRKRQPPTATPVPPPAIRQPKRTRRRRISSSAYGLIPIEHWNRNRGPDMHRATEKAAAVFAAGATDRALFSDPLPGAHCAFAPAPNATDDVHYAYHGTAMNPDTDLPADYLELSQCSEGPEWIQSNREEIGRLCQGLGKNSAMPTGTETMFFIDVKNIPAGRKPTYLRIVAADRPEKANPKRVRWTVGGDRIDYPGDCSTKTADLTTCKLLFNSVISTPDARFMTIDLKDFYLETPMERFEYMRIPVNVIPDDLMELYNLAGLVHNGGVYVEIRRGMYGLPQAGRIANDRLVKFLAAYGYAPCKRTHGLWRHSTRDIVFTLVVDDFGVKYTKREDAEHLEKCLNNHYKCSTEWDGARYCGLTIDWDYENRTVDVSMPGYIERALKRFEHPTPPRRQNSPHAWQKPVYGAKTQYAPDEDTTPPLDKAGKLRVQEVLGTLLFYARAVDGTMLAAVGSIATKQATPTETTLAAINQLLDYCATHPNAKVRYTASEMQLWIDSDASYLSEAKARSRLAGIHYLSDRLKDPSKPPAPSDPPPMQNGAVHIPCVIIRAVMSSAAEAELGGLFHNAQDACPLIATLEEMGHRQGPVPLQTDNSTAAGIANDTVKQKRSKAVDMRFYWIQDRTAQGQFLVYWRKGKQNRADYFTKHHPASHHKAIRSVYIYDPRDTGRNYFECLQDDED
jgi:hypothetical protein